MSLPANASWTYNYLPDFNSEEGKSQKLLIKGVNWIN
jgi:coproporphyrinogen III oxidase